MDSIGFPLNLKLRIWIGYLISFAAWIAAQLFFAWISDFTDLWL